MDAVSEASDVSIDRGVDRSILNSWTIDHESIVGPTRFRDPDSAILTGIENLLLHPAGKLPPCSNEPEALFFFSLKPLLNEIIPLPIRSSSIQNISKEYGLHSLLSADEASQWM